MAVAFHEAWKPAAFDADLHARLGTSYASNTFLVVRAALRREAVLALLRLWDRDDRAVSMPKVARALRDSRVLDELVAECEARWGASHERGDLFPDESEEVRRQLSDMITRSEAAYGREQGEAIRRLAAEAIELIARYERNGDKHNGLQLLKRVRDKRLAHREVAADLTSAELADELDSVVEAVFKDMATLIRLLRLVVEGVGCEPAETAAIRARHARLFWGGVKGERTEGHPEYKARSQPAQVEGLPGQLDAVQ